MVSIGTQFDLTVIQGSSFEWLIKVLDVNGSPLNMTGYTGGTAGARGQIRKKYEDVSPTKSFTITILNKTGINSAITAGNCHLTTQEIADLEPDSAGKCYLLVRLPASDTTSLIKGNYFYDIEVEDTTGFVFKPYFGQVSVLPEATKAVAP